MTRIAIGPETCGLRLTPSGLRELRGRRGKDTWFYEAEFGGASGFEVMKHVLVPREAESLPDHSHARPYDAYFGDGVPGSEAELVSGHELYEFLETEDRTATDLLNMVDYPEEGWFSYRVKAVEVPDGVEWYLYEDEDGSESIHEKHRSWS